MSVSISVHVERLDELRDAFRKAPNLAREKIKKAVYASIFEVEKESTDRNFQFKWPRSRRTGQLEQSFKRGMFIHPSGLYASIGPTVKYAPYVYFGTRNMRPNRFMDRIANSAEPKVNRHFNDAVDAIIESLV